jgi:formate-dependent nitrite reductase membrane component NrfD
VEAIPSSSWFTAAPHWGWLVVGWFFFSGLAAGCYFLAAVIDLFGRPEDRPLARVGYLTVLPCLVLCGIALIVDLGRPDRFWHMLVQNNTLVPMIKYWSPISLGSWVLPLLSFFALLSFIGALADTERVRWSAARRLRPPGPLGAVIAVIGALLAMWLAGYTGVLLAVTNRPIWSDTPLLGLLLLLSSFSVAAAYMALLARRNRWTLPGVLALERIDVWVLVLELIVLVIVVVSLGPVARAWLSAWGLLLFIGVVIAGIALPLAIHGRRERYGEGAPVLAAVLVILAGFLLRMVIVFSSDAIHL